jgi:integrase
VKSLKDVQPIRDELILKEFMKQLREHNERDFMIFVVGISSGYRITDQLKLFVEDVRNRESFRITESKTRKIRRVPIDCDVRKLLDDYIQGRSDKEYLFPSRQRNRLGDPKPLDRTTVYKMLNKVAKRIGIWDSFGCHSMRKTFGYFHYKRYRDLAVLMEIFGHSKPEITLRYIGMTQSIVNKTVLGLRIIRGKIPPKGDKADGDQNGEC